MKKEKKIKKSNKIVGGIKHFFSSIKIIMIALIILVVIVLAFCYHLMTANKTYMFNGKSDSVSVLNGVINLTDGVNVFEGSDIEYLADDQTITSYEIGYYVKVDGKYQELVVNKGSDTTGISLKNLLNSNLLSFNVTEASKNGNSFTKANKKALKSGLYFIINAKTKDSKTINNITNINLSKVSR